MPTRKQQYNPDITLASSLTLIIPNKWHIHFKSPRKSSLSCIASLFGFKYKIKKVKKKVQQVGDETA